MNLYFEISDSEDDDTAGAAFSVILFQALVARNARNARRRQNRLYLCRRELLPNPRIGTPWQRLWESQEDRAFITTMGLDVTTFRLILEGPGGFGEQWEASSIPRHDVSRVGEPRTARRSLDGAGALALFLHWVGSAMIEVSLQQIFALTPTTCNRLSLFLLI